MGWRQKYRLWCCRWLYFWPKVGEWNTCKPTWRHNLAWRVMPNGEYDYRELTDAEEWDNFEAGVW